MDDQQLVNDFLKNRSEKAFNRLYQAKTPRLYQMALRLTAHDPYQAEELIQEMWIIAIRKLEGFEWRSELRTWLTGILINLSRTSRKQQEKEKIMEQEFETDITEPPIYNVMDLEQAISELPSGYRQAIILHDIEGYKHREIAEIMDISEGTSKSQLFHARKAMKFLLTEKAKS